MTDDIDMTEFLATDQNDTPVPVVVTGLGKIKKTRKTKSTPYCKGGGDTELQDMRKKAKSLCSCYEQYRSVSKYKKERLKEWLQQKEFDTDAALRASVFTFAHKFYATAVDFFTKGDGLVAARLGSDLTLRTAIEDEGRDLIKYLNNKTKILFLTASDTFEAKKEQREKKKLDQPVTIEVVTNHEQQQPSNHEAGVYTGDVPGAIENDDTADEQVLPMCEGEEEARRGVGFR
jgi:hypothetical protein